MKTTKPSTAGLRLEALEDRLALSSTVISGDLYIYGTSGADSVTVNYEVYSGVGYYKVTQNGVNSFFRASRVYGGDIGFYGYAGNDYFNNNTGLRTFAWGMDGDDTLLGSWNNDKLDGGNGRDYLYGYGGNDILYGGLDYNYNYLNGGSGHDSLYGGWTGDTLVGESGNDYLYGNHGYDLLYGGDGNDTLHGGDDGYWDYLNGGTGQDWFQQDWYWNGTKWINRDAGSDFLSGWDKVYG